MSVAVQTWAWGLKLPHEEQFVLIALADHAHDDGSRCYPGVAYLAWKCNLSDRTVQRCLRKLEARGLIEPVGSVVGGHGKATEYQIHIEKGVKKSPFQRKPRVTSTTSKGDIYDGKDDIQDKNHVVDVTPTINEPSEKTSQEPSGCAPAPDPSYIPILTPFTGETAAPTTTPIPTEKNLAILWRDKTGQKCNPTQSRALHTFADEYTIRGKHQDFVTIFDDAALHNWKTGTLIDVLGERLTSKPGHRRTAAAPPPGSLRAMAAGAGDQERYLAAAKRWNLQVV